MIELIIDSTNLVILLRKIRSRDTQRSQTRLCKVLEMILCCYLNLFTIAGSKSFINDGICTLWDSKIEYMSL